MFKTTKLTLLAVGVFGLSSLYQAQVLNTKALKEKCDQMIVREQTNTIRSLQFKENNGLDGRVFFNQFLSPSLNPAVHFELMKEEHDAIGYTHFRFQQFIGTYRVEGAEFVISQNEKGISFASGYLFNADITLPQPNLDGVSAVNMAKSYVDATTYKWEVPEEEQYIKLVQNSPTASFYPDFDLVVVANPNQPNAFKLAYKLDIYAHAPMSREYIYVDAMTGDLIKRVNRIHASNEHGSGITLYNGTQNFVTDSHQGTHRLKEQLPVNGVTRSIHTHDMNEGTNYNNAVEFTDADNYWTDNTNQDRAGWSAHWGAEATWDYFFYELGRNSYDNNGATINSYVHYDNNYNNAFWDGTRMTYGDGDGSQFDPLVSLDVVGHEITHAVTERTSNLVYQNESGALNESFSDIFGTAIEFYKEGSSADWLIGEDFDAQNGTGFRSMINPNDNSDPDTYGGTYWKSNSLFPSLADDYGGVHSNSGVQNFWFYVLTVGKNGTNDNGDNYSVTGIGIQKAAAIAYRNNATKLSTNSDYADARAGAIASAIELYGAGSQEVISTTNAWYAVGVGDAYQGGPATCDVPNGLSTNGATQTSVTLNWSNVGAANGYNVRYRESGTSTWTNTTASSNSLNIGGLTAATTYEFQVESDCGSSSSGYSASGTFTTQSSGGGNPVNYCASSGNNSSDEWIDQVNVGSYSNASGNNNGYGDFTSSTIAFTAGDSYNFTLTPGFSGGGVFGASTYPEYWKIWIDYNQDGDFNDAGELAYDAGGTNTSAVSGSISIPTGALTGNTRMRVSMKYNGSQTACETFSYGEVEDYTVNIQPNTPPTCDAPTALSSSNVDHQSADLSWTGTAAANGYTISYRESGGSWNTTSSSSTTKQLTNLSASINYEWKVESNCGSTNSIESSVETFTTGAQPVCGDVSNLSANNVGETSADLSWTAGGNADSYEVRYRIVGGAWNTVSASATSTTLSGLNDNTSYQWEVRTICSFGNSGYTSGPNFTTEETQAPPVSYCNAQGNSTADEWIASIAVGNLSNSSGNNNGYGDFTAQTLTCAVGSVQNLSLAPGFSSGGLFGSSSYPEYWRIWIDYNQDGDFDDAGELAFDAGGTSTSTVTGSFTVSANATIGATRMRIAMKYNGAPTPCESFSYGEVEDYTIQITSGASFGAGNQEAGQPTVLTPSQLALYPNPNSGKFQVNADAEGKLKVLTMNGAVVHEQAMGRHNRLDLGQLSSGVYLVHLSFGQKTEIKKLVIQ